MPLVILDADITSKQIRAETKNDEMQKIERI